MTLRCSLLRVGLLSITGTLPAFESLDLRGAVIVVPADASVPERTAARMLAEGDPDVGMETTSSRDGRQRTRQSGL